MASEGGGGLGIERDAALHQPAGLQRLGDGLQHFGRLEWFELVVEGRTWWPRWPCRSCPDRSSRLPAGSAGSGGFGPMPPDRSCRGGRYRGSRDPFCRFSGSAWPLRRRGRTEPRAPAWKGCPRTRGGRCVRRQRQESWPSFFSALSCGATGTQMANVVPFSVDDSKTNSPPWRTMICAAMQRPRPVPLSLVVKKGSKRRR